MNLCRGRCCQRNMAEMLDPWKHCGPRPKRAWLTIGRLPICMSGPFSNAPLIFYSNYLMDPEHWVVEKPEKRNGNSWRFFKWLTRHNGLVFFFLTGVNWKSFPTKGGWISYWCTVQFQLNVVERDFCGTPDRLNICACVRKWFLRHFVS